MGQESPAPPINQPPYASFFVRLAAHLFDRFLFILPVLTIGILLNLDISQTKGIKEITIVIYFVYLILTTKIYQKSLGKHAFGMRIVFEGNQPISWGRSFVREFLARLISEIFLLGYLYALLNKKRQTFHDKVSKIIVIQEKPLTRRTRFFVILIVIGLPLISLLFAYKLISRSFKQISEIWYRSNALQQKIDLLEYIGPLCRSYHSQALLLRENYCKNRIAKKQECKLTDLSLMDLKELDSNLEKLSADCFKLQSEFEKKPSPQNVPSINGANLLISAFDERLFPLEEGILEIKVYYADFPDRNFSYSVDINSLRDGLLPLNPPPSQIPATVLIKITTPTGKVSDTLVIKNEQYWNAVKTTKQNYVAIHQFDLKKTGEVTNIIYNALNVPPIAGGNLQISVVDEQGQLVEEGTITISVNYQDFPDRNYSYSIDLKSLQNKLLPLNPPPSHISATVSVWVITPTGNISDTLTLRNDQYWNAVAATKQDFVASHQFDLRKKGEIIKIVYNE